jgi:hypothetical protein
MDSAPSDEEVDLWHEGTRVTDCWQDHLGRWCRLEGPPRFIRILNTPPSFWHAKPADPIIPKGE